MSLNNKEQRSNVLNVRNVSSINNTSVASWHYVVNSHWPLKHGPRITQIRSLHKAEGPKRPKFSSNRYLNLFWCSETASERQFRTFWLGFRFLKYLVVFRSRAERHQSATFKIECENLIGVFSSIFVGATRATLRILNQTMSIKFFRRK